MTTANPTRCPHIKSGDNLGADDPLAPDAAIHIQQITLQRAKKGDIVRYVGVCPVCLKGYWMHG